VSEAQEKPHFATWAASMAASVAIVYGALSESVRAQNVALGLCWFSIAATPFLCAVLSETSEPMRKLRLKFGRRPLYRIYSCRIADAAVGLTLAAVGWWWTFAFFILHTFVSLAVEGASADEIKKADPSHA